VTDLPFVTEHPVRVAVSIRIPAMLRLATLEIFVTGSPPPYLRRLNFNLLPYIVRVLAGPAEGVVFQRPLNSLTSVAGRNWFEVIEEGLTPDISLIYLCFALVV
jgi:hypothetical protein